MFPRLNVLVHVLNTQALDSLECMRLDYVDLLQYKPAAPQPSPDMYIAPAQDFAQAAQSQRLESDQDY